MVEASLPDAVASLPSGAGFYPGRGYGWGAVGATPDGVVAGEDGVIPASDGEAGASDSASTLALAGGDRGIPPTHITRGGGRLRRLRLATMLRLAMLPSGYSQADPSSYDPGSYNPGSYNIDSQDYQENQNNYPTGYSNTDYSNPESTNYVGPTSQQLAESAVRQIPNARPEVRNAIRALSGMPPAARERELATGLYASFSPEERQVVRAAVFTPATNTNARTIERAAVRAPAQHRREVQNAIRTLQAMPPAARERQINSGVYSSFSPSERQMLKTVAQVQTGM